MVAIKKTKKVSCVACGNTAKTKRMTKIAQNAMKNAHAPYSNCYVGACAEAGDGSFFGGCNVENASYGITLCAECSAISALISAGKKQVKSILIVASWDGLATPCGRCRQLIREFATLDTPIYMCDKYGVLQETMTMEQLLPKSFDPDHLKKYNHNKKR